MSLTPLSLLSVVAILQLGTAARAADPSRQTVIVVVGAEGSPEYAPEFRRWADRWVAAAGRADADVVSIGIDSPEDNETDRQRLQTALESRIGAAATQPSATQPLATQATSQPAVGGAPLWVVLIGHGTFDGREAKFNLRGPDVSDVELAAWLTPCARPLAVINCSSASAPFINRLSAAGRIVVAATRSGVEVQYSRFGDFFSRAIADASADLDKDGQTSLLEAFLSASAQTEGFYKETGRLATEHALIDDNGDGLGAAADFFQGTRAVRAPKAGATVDGRRAHQVHLVLSPAELAMSAEQRSARDELELQLQGVRDRKATMSEENYYALVETILLKLARIYDGRAEDPTSQPTQDAVPRN